MILPSIRKTGSYGAAPTEREKSRRIRSCFTDMLREHGYSKRHEYINTTRAIKKELGIKEKKDDMTDRKSGLLGEKKSTGKYLAAS